MQLSYNLIVALLALSSATNPQAEFNCLVQNIYFEARNQTTEGMFAVAEVTKNRVRNPMFPNTICGVVKQYKQFSWYWDGKSNIMHNSFLVFQAQEVAKVSLLYTANFTNGALYYHTHRVHPDWADTFSITTIIGDHIFYRNN
jgi:spore germination cell wall hydrolase CwlJ-like protein